MGGAIYGAGCEALGLPPEVVAASLGKAVPDPPNARADPRASDPQPAAEALLGAPPTPDGSRLWRIRHD